MYIDIYVYVSVWLCTLYLCVCEQQACCIYNYTMTSYPSRGMAGPCSRAFHLRGCNMASSRRLGRGL